LDNLFVIYLQKSLKTALEAPEFVFTDFAKFDRPGQLHIAFQALSEYVKTKGGLPKSRCKVIFIVVSHMLSFRNCYLF